MATNFKRYKIIDSDNLKGLKKCDTTEECFEFLKTLPMTDLPSTLICCSVDDIEVNGLDFFEVFERGETPMDLQFF